MRDTLIAGTLSYFVLLAALIYHRFDNAKEIYKDPHILILQYLFMGLILLLILRYRPKGIIPEKVRHS